MDLKDIANVLTEDFKNRIAREDYRFYLQISHHFIYNHARHTYLICEKLKAIEEGRLKKLMIFLPPRHSKSQTITETFPSYYMSKNPNKNMIIVSYSDNLAQKFGRKNKQKVKQFAPSVFGRKLSEDNASNHSFSIEGGSGQALFTGIGGSVTGQGAHILIIDDPIKNRKEAFSETYRNSVFDEYESSLYTRLAPNGAVILIMTRWHEDDLAGRLLAKEGDEWEVINLPCIAESEDDLLGRDIGEPLWSEFGFDEDWAKETRNSVGEVTWNALYQQRPSASEGNIIKRDWFRFYDKAPTNFEDFIISVDASFKGDKDNDFCVLQVWGKIKADKYLLDQIREQMNFPQTVNALRSLVGRYPAVRTKLIEDKANGSAIIDYLKHEISGIVPVTPKESKEARLSAVSVEFESGNVYFPNPVTCKWSAQAIEEIVSFPNAKHDDIVDACSQALQRWQHPTGIWIGRA